MNHPSSGDEGDGCMSESIKHKYGDYNTSWIKVNESESFYCVYDMDNVTKLSDTNATFTCTKDHNDEMILTPVFACIKTNKSDAIENIAIAVSSCTPI